jgi:predicted GH43/DUF377 family glycosyl hydrolase
MHCSRARALLIGAAVWVSAEHFVLPSVAGVPAKLKPWLGPQNWERDTDGQILSLGESGQFDDTHIFAPAVIRENDRYLLWYCGSQGSAYDLAPTRQADERVFKLGLATSSDGRKFQKHFRNPVMALGDGIHSILTPCVLREADGTPIWENGKLRMWYASAVLGGDRIHTIHEATSADGLTWNIVSDALIKNAYCPSVVKTDNGYEMWYTEAVKYPWLVRHARSADGRNWTVTEKVVLALDQTWEHYVLVYPSVIKVDNVYCLWYGSYTDESRNYTALGFAVSEDGIRWYKHPDNPVLRYEPSRPWESHYVTSESVIRLPDGSFRIWYASRKAPPFRNLYFAINTARWLGPTLPNGK